MAHHYDICIRGGGIVGHTLALLLARERLRVGLVRAPVAAVDTKLPDVRVYALNAKSKSMLESVRCWPDAQCATAVTEMQVMGDAGGQVIFSAADLDVDALTWIVDVPTLEAQLEEAVRFQPQIELLETPGQADLTVVCEGKTSTSRAEFGVEFVVNRYSQHAVAARLQCELPHAQIARQWFTPGEILAFLPLQGSQGREVGIVWSVQESRAEAVLQSTEAEFCSELEQISGGTLGKLNLGSRRVAWPLQTAQASRWVGRTGSVSWALAGDAAHNVHPLAGQGLNLGLSDVAELVQVLRSRAYWRSVADPRLLRRYERGRRAEVSATGWVMDGLQQLFVRDHRAWQLLRNWGMRGFDASGLVKHQAARLAMGL